MVFDGESVPKGTDTFDVSFYVASPSGIDGSSTLKNKFPTKEFIKTTISFKRSDLDKYIWGIIYYMVAFDSTIIIREADGYHRPTILAGSLLGGLITPDYLDKKGANFRVYPLGEGDPDCAFENYKRWKREVREIIKHMPLYPIQLLSDAENLAIWFNRFFNTGLRIDEIRFLEYLQRE